MALNRWFYRCTGCLEVVALDAPLKMEWSLSQAVCATCEQRFELMGRVTDNRLLADHIECVCDDRCTSARGPKCNCGCGGKNHGIGMAGYITVTTEIGGVPRVTLPDSKWRGKALAQWAEFRDGRAEVRAMLDVYLDRRQAGEFLPRADFDRMRALQTAMGAANKARSHAGRMKALRAALPIATVAA